MSKRNRPSRRERKAGKGIFKQLLRGEYDSFEETVKEMSDDGLWKQITELEIAIARKPRPTLLKMQDIMMEEAARRGETGRD